MSEFRILSGSEADVLPQLTQLTAEGWNVVGFTTGANPPLNFAILLCRKGEKKKH